MRLFKYLKTKSNNSNQYWLAESLIEKIESVSLTLYYKFNCYRIAFFIKNNLRSAL